MTTIARLPRNRPSSGPNSRGAAPAGVVPSRLGFALAPIRNGRRKVSWTLRWRFSGGFRTAMAVSIQRFSSDLLQMGVHSRPTETCLAQGCAGHLLQMGVHSRPTETAARTPRTRSVLQMGVHSRPTETATHKEKPCHRCRWASILGRLKQH